MSPPSSSNAATTPRDQSRSDSPFHAGERALQDRVGARERLDKVGRKVIRDFMPEQHRELFAALPFIVVGSVDRQHRPWASIVVGTPGFASAPDARTLIVGALPISGDPVREGLVAGAPVGLLGIQLETRRRNRLNGTVVRAGDAGFEVSVGQSFGNCPQYIHARRPHFAAPASAAASRVETGKSVLSARAAALVERADTFFIATAAPAASDGRAVEGVDVSHRGGKPGFVRVTKEDGCSVLTSPDFAGNSFFNTFGNLVLDPRAAIVFVNFDSGDLLSLTGEADVIWGGPEVEAFVGAQRLLRFKVRSSVWIENAVALRWSQPEPAPQLAATGSWDQAARSARSLIE